MDQTSYEQKVSERAEEFHKIDPSIDIEFDRILDAFARLSLQRESEAFRKGFSEGYDTAIDPEKSGWADKHLKSLGLVP